MGRLPIKIQDKVPTPDSVEINLTIFALCEAAANGFELRVPIERNQAKRSFLRNSPFVFPQ